jgi:hypothetical protein
MPQAKKLWRPLKVWHSDEWVPFEKAWQRVKKVIWSDLWLMQRDLRQEFLGGRLIMAVRFFAPNGTETMRIILAGVLAVAQNQLRIVDNGVGSDTRVGSGRAQGGDVGFSCAPSRTG